MFESSVAELVNSGVIVHGARWHLKYHGVAYEVIVRPDGRLEAGGEVYDSPSQAARLMTGQKVVNGWAVWLTESCRPVGELRSS